MAAEQESTNLNLGYEIFIAIISVLSVIDMFLIFIPHLEQNIVNVIIIINTVLTVIFLFDFGLRIYVAQSRSFYFFHDYGWADLLACSPVLRFLRLFRIFKAYRLVKKYGARHLASYLSRNRAEVALYILIIAAIIIIQMGSILVLMAESVAPSANIRTGSDAIWWAYATITTVGYGDRFPVTGEGRIVGILVMTTGVAVFATFAGYIANKLLKPPQKEEEAGQVTGFSSPSAVTLAELKQYLVERERIDAKIMTRLEALERQTEGEQTSLDPKPSM
jgi:voltage-gated potassium channel